MIARSVKSLRLIAATFIAAGALAASTLPSVAYVEQFGVYGTRWTPWMKLNHHFVGFYVYQVPHRARDKDYQAIAEMSATGTEVIAMQGFHKSLVERFMRDGATPDRPASAVADKIARIYDNPAMNGINALSLDEENFWWNGRGEYLGNVYRAVKARMPNRQLWQWFNDNQRRRSPIEDRYSIPADGYLADPYSVPLDEYESRLQGYVRQGKPVVVTLWASPNWRHGQRRIGRQTEWWDNDGWRTFYIKAMTNRRYGIRTALFMYDLPLNGSPMGRLTPGFESEDPCIRAFTKKLFTVTLPQLGSIPLDSPVPASRPDWMAERCPAQ